MTDETQVSATSPAQAALVAINEGLRAAAEMLTTPEAERVHRFNCEAFGIPYESPTPQSALDWFDDDDNDEPSWLDAIADSALPLFLMATAALAIIVGIGLWMRYGVGS